MDKGSFPHLEIVPIELNSDNLEFYTDAIWYEDSLVNVIVGFDDEKENLDLAVELYNRVYIEQAQTGLTMPKVLFGVFDEMLLSKIVNENRDEFNNFFTYGNINDILNHQEFIDEEGDLLGKLINYSYTGFLVGEEKLYNKEKLVYFKTNATIREDIQKAWYDNASHNDKLSSIAQAKLMDMKLKSLSLKKVIASNNAISTQELLQKNRAIFDAQLDEEFQGECTFVNEFDSTIFKNLTRMEHNRWNTYHHLNGWKYSTKKNKAAKLHNCLLPLEKFDTKELQETIIYDIYSFMYIPNYLAEAGYILEKSR